MTIIDPATRQSYLETQYHVYGDTPLTLQVGVANPTLAALYKELHIEYVEPLESCAFITACNPLGQSLEACVNADLHTAFAVDLRQRGLTFMEGVGLDPSGQWPGEASFLVWGPSLQAAKDLGIQYQQNAIIWCASDAVPQLIFLR